MPFNVKLMYFFLCFVYILFDSKLLYGNSEFYPYNCVTNFSFFFNSFYLCVGVEHLLRDVKDTTISTLVTEVSFVPFNLLLILINSFPFELFSIVTFLFYVFSLYYFCDSFKKMNWCWELIVLFLHR